MKTGDIILIPFPFAELTDRKIRPATVIAVTKDKYQDILVAAISSVVPDKISENEMILKPTTINKLRAMSVLKIDRIVTVKRQNLVARLGKLTDAELILFKKKFRNLVK